MTGDSVAERIALTWATPLGLVPLTLNTGFDGLGIHGGGLVPFQRYHKEPPVDLNEVLQEAGLAMAPERLQVSADQKRAERERLNGEAPSFLAGYPEPAAYDRALIRSLAQQGGLQAGAGADYAMRWIAKFSRHEAAPDAQDRALFDELYDSAYPVPHEVSVLRQFHPEYFVGGVERFYVDATSTNLRIRSDSIIGIVSVALRQTPEQNAPQADAYLNLVNDTNLRDTALLNAVGRFQFDPVPVLRGYLQKSERPAAVSTEAALIAVCRSDARWTKSLVPFVIETVHLFLLGDDDVEDWRIYKDALTVLDVLGQREAWDGLRSEMRPEVLERLGEIAFGRGRCW